MVEPPPSQKPHPPFWVAAGSEASIRRAAQRGFNLILDQYASPEQLGQRIALYRAEREAAGDRSDPMQIAVARQLYVAKDKADAEAALQSRRRGRSAPWMSRALPGAQGRLARAGLCGTPRYRGECALRHAGQHLQQARGAPRRAGVEYVLLTMHGGAEQLRRVARDIMPAFHTKPAHSNAEAVSARTPV